MTEKQKMLAGELYDSRDPELLNLYHKTRQLLQEYNQLHSELLQERNRILRELFGDLATGVWIEAPFFCDYGENISIGAYSFVHMNCMFLDNHKITIGKHGLIGPFVQIYTASHPMEASKRIITSEEGSRYRTKAHPVSIGDNVWIGGNAIILPGVTIGNNVTIGAGSVITKNIPDNVLALGNPCKVIKKLE